MLTVTLSAVSQSSNPKSNASLIAVERYWHSSLQTTVLTYKMGMNEITNLIEPKEDEGHSECPVSMPSPSFKGRNTVFFIFVSV